MNAQSAEQAAAGHRRQGRHPLRRREAHRDHDLEVRRVGHAQKRGTFVPLPLAWRVEVAHGRLLRQRRLARSFGNTLESATGWLQVACLAAALDAIFSPSPPWRRQTRPAAAC